MWQVVVVVGGRWKIAEVGVGSALTGSRKLGLQNTTRSTTASTNTTVYTVYTVFTVYTISEHAQCIN